MRTPYFFERLDSLTDFEGFVGRWYFPSETLTADKTGASDITTALVIDSQREIKIGVGYDWPPVVLGNEELQLQQLIAKFLGIDIGDSVKISLDFSSYLGD